MDSEEDAEGKKKKKKENQRPNYFISIPITNPEVDNYTHFWLESFMCVCLMEILFAYPVQLSYRNSVIIQNQLKFTFRLYICLILVFYIEYYQYWIGKVPYFFILAMLMLINNQ